MSVLFDKPTHSFKCNTCGLVVEVSKRTIYNSLQFVTMKDTLERLHRSCRQVVLQLSVAHEAETDWRREMRALGM